MIDRLPILALLALASLPAMAAAPSTQRNFSSPASTGSALTGPIR
jgi:hypothetical protein